MAVLGKDGERTHPLWVRTIHKEVTGTNKICVAHGWDGKTVELLTASEGCPKKKTHPNHHTKPKNPPPLRASRRCGDTEEVLLSAEKRS